MNKQLKRQKYQHLMSSFSNINLKLIIRLNYYLFPVLWCLTFFVGLLESFTYQGYAFKHLLLPFQILVILSVFCGIVVLVTQNRFNESNGQYSIYKTVFDINKLLITPLVMSYILVNSLEAQNYHNYVFSQIHLQPKLFFWPVFMSAFLFIVGSLFYRRNSNLIKLFLTEDGVVEMKSKKQILMVFARIGVFTLLINMLMLNIGEIFDWGYQRTKFMVSNPVASYDDKMRYGWGDFYDYMVFVRENTPEDAVIMFPPMIDPWMDVGGGGLIRYFLYPRNILQDMENAYADIPDNVDYVMLVWGNGVCAQEKVECYGWPKSKVEASRIIYKQAKSSQINYILKDVTYNPNDDVNKGAWGVIELRKEKI